MADEAGGSDEGIHGDGAPGEAGGVAKATAAGSPGVAGDPVAARRRTVRTAVLVVLAAALVLLVGVVVANRNADPQRPGTRHAARLTADDCATPQRIVLDGRLWRSPQTIPPAWGRTSGRGVTGTLEVVADDEGVFTTDEGPGSLTFRRLREGQFDDLSCAIR